MEKTENTSIENDALEQSNNQTEKVVGFLYLGGWEIVYFASSAAKEGVLVRFGEVSSH